MKTDSLDLSRRVVVALVVDEVVSEADMVFVAVRVASAAAAEDLVVAMEAVVVEVLAVVDMVDLSLVATTLVAHRYLQIRSLTSQLPVRREVKRSTFATFVSQSFLHTSCSLTFGSSHGQPAMRISSSCSRQSARLSRLRFSTSLMADLVEPGLFVSIMPRMPRLQSQSFLGTSMEVVLLA